MDEKQLIDDLEKESMLELEVMHESENTDNERIIEDAKSKIEKLFDDVRDLLKDASDPEKVKEALSQAKEEDAKDILSSTKDKVVEVSESEQFKQTMSAGKEFLQGTAGLVVEGFKCEDRETDIEEVYLKIDEYIKREPKQMKLF